MTKTMPVTFGLFQSRENERTKFETPQDLGQFLESQGATEVPSKGAPSL